jgi:hypothetical protein
MKYHVIVLGCLAAILALGAAEGDAPTARDRYFEGARNNDAEWIGIRTSIVLRRGANRAATIREVGESADFHSEDQFRIRLQTNSDGYVYLLFHTPTGDYKVLYPAKEAKVRSNQVRSFEDRTLPGRSKEWLAFDAKPAIEGLYIVFSPAPVAELERVIAGSGILLKAEFTGLSNENGGTASMVFDEPEDEDSGLVPATFYVEKRAAGRTFLIRRVDLVHRAARKDGIR